MSDMQEFDRIMKSFYQNRYEDVQQVNRMLWDFVIELVRAIHEHESSSARAGSSRSCRRIGGKRLWRWDATRKALQRA
jgi:hypothetical protein